MLELILLILTAECNKKAASTNVSILTVGTIAG